MTLDDYFTLYLCSADDSPEQDYAISVIEEALDIRFMALGK